MNLAIFLSLSFIIRLSSEYAYLSVVPAFAPFLIRNSALFMCMSAKAWTSGVQPVLSLVSRSALGDTSVLAASILPSETAFVSAVRPCSSFASTFAPLEISVFMISESPLAAASIKAVRPWASLAFGLAPSLRSRATSAFLPFSIAANNRSLSSAISTHPIYA